MSTKLIGSVGLILALGLLLPCRAESWAVSDKQVGDPQANYLNVEVTADSKYLVWFEGAEGSRTSGTVWHCGIDQSTGELIPADGRGFRAFESTSWGRANPGYDAQGVYYIGADTQGRLVMVRPDGPTSGKVTILPTQADTRRRAIYPTNLPDRDAGYVLFIRNEKTPGAGMRPLNDWVELQYIDLRHPQRVHTIERQETPHRGFAPVDAGFVRWMRGRALITYGYQSERSGKVEIRMFDAEHPERGAIDLVEDGHNKIDPYPAVIGDYEYLMAGIDATATSQVYRRRAGQPAGTPFELYRRLYPEDSDLKRPSLAQSHEPFEFQGRLYTVYQVNEQGRGFFQMTFRQPGEIWLADLSAEPVRQWRIAPANGAPVAEPEPLVTDACVWVFYNRPIVEERDTPSKAIRLRKTLPRLALYRATTPICSSRN